jgi:hypothetical protein
MRNTAEPIVRPAAVAGHFYPADPRELAAMVDDFVRAAPVRGGRVDPKAVIAPHAGYLYSGPIGGSAFAAWARSADAIRRVVLLGPSHWVDFKGLALPDAVSFRTPLGEVPLDLEAVRSLLGLPQVRVFNPGHAHEHALEVELPFLQRTLKEFRIVPLVVGDAADREISDVIERLWGGPETRFVVSSDLSHYHDYPRAFELDHDTARAVEQLQAERLTGDRACGYRPIRGFVRSAARRGMWCEAVDLRNSGDTAGPKHRVVGYGAFYFGTPPAAAPPGS